MLKYFSLFAKTLPSHLCFVLLYSLSLFQKCSLLFVFSPLAQNFPLFSLSISLFLPTQFFFFQAVFLQAFFSLLHSPLRYVNLPSLCPSMLQTVLSKNDCQTYILHTTPTKTQTRSWQHKKINYKSLLPSPNLNIVNGKNKPQLWNTNPLPYV